jgi:hypothetical protein
MAVYLGREAYALEHEAYHKIFKERYKGSKDHKGEYQPHIRTDGYDKLLHEQSPAFVQVPEPVLQEHLAQLATMGSSGMGIPWHQSNAKVYTELPANNRETLAWIAGPRGRLVRTRSPAPRCRTSRARTITSQVARRCASNSC